MSDEEILSQEEVESLLSAMESPPKSDSDAEVAETPTATAKRVSAAVAQRAGSARLKPAEKVSPYDFKRPERVGKEQIRALQSLHEGFGRNFGATLSALLRSIVEVKLTSVDQLTYSEFVFSLENPTCFNLLTADALEGHLILDINPSILYPIIDRLLGGGKHAAAPARRPLTEIELRLVRQITDRFLAEMRSAWSNVIDLNLVVDRVESNPQLVQIVPPNEVVVLIGFELTLGETRGMLNLCIPYNSIERISSKLTSNSWSYNKSASNDESRSIISEQMGSSRVEMAVTLAETTITTADLLGLRVGDIITTDHDIRQLLQVSVANHTKFLASPGCIKGRAAVEIRETLDVPPPDRSESSA